MKRFTLLLFILLSPVVLFAGESTLYGSLGRYHRGYDDRAFTDDDKITFSTSMSTIGGYHIEHFSDGEVIGVGVVQTTIQSGKGWNYDQYEYQDFMSITVPYLFIGKAWRFFSFNIGISYYLTVKKYADRQYQTEDGTTIQKDSGGYDLSRNSSHVFPNFKIRMLPKDWIHIELRLSQDRFLPTDTLMNLAIVYPSEWGRFELYFGLKTPQDYINDLFANDSDLLTSNQKVGIWYDYKIGPFAIGLDVGYLLKNIHGGGGEMFSSERFAGGFSLSLQW